MNNLHDRVINCKLCELHKKLPSGCSPVMEIPENTSKFLIVGEAPGANEILLSQAFVGACGMLLNKILESAKINRENVRITNTVRCRPTDTGTKNRPPTKLEILICGQYLTEEIEILKPKVIVTLGKVPTHFLLKTIKKTTSMDVLCGNKFNYKNIAVFPCYHPSYLMQYGKDKLNKAIQCFESARKYFNGQEHT